MMIAELKGIVTAALLIGGLSCVAGGLAAAGRADRERPAAGSAGSAPKTPEASRIPTPATAVRLGTGENTPVAFTAAAPGLAGGPATESSSNAAEQDQPGQTTNYTKDFKPRR
jgi:hypothetical protein